MRNFSTFCFVLMFAFSSSTIWAASTNPRVLLQTNLGQLVIELFPREAPNTVKNFLEYVDNDFYEGTIFQRVVPGFFIQGGGYTTHFLEKNTRSPIKSEANNGLKNEYQMVSMAHTNTTDVKMTGVATSQFFINMQNNPALDINGNSAGYTVFGKVIEGIETAEIISLQPRGMYEHFPEAPNSSVHILKIQRISTHKSLTENKPETESSKTAPTNNVPASTAE